MPCSVIIDIDHEADFDPKQADTVVVRQCISNQTVAAEPADMD